MDHKWIWSISWYTKSDLISSLCTREQDRLSGYSRIPSTTKPSNSRGTKEFLEDFGKGDIDDWEADYAYTQDDVHPKDFQDSDMYSYD